MSAVTVSRASYAFVRRMALEAVSLEIAEGESFGIMGPNGSGKSTLLGLLSTRLAPAAGTVSVFGVDAVAAPQAVRRSIGVVAQGETLDRFLTVRENLDIWAGLQGMRKDSIPVAVGEALAASGLADRAADRAGSLSGGLARRAELARALLHGPDLLLLDEPTLSLDPAARAEWRDRVDGVRKQKNLTVVTCTHDPDEAGRCDRVAFMAAGRIVEVGTPSELCAKVGAPVVTVVPAGEPQGLADRIGQLPGVTAAVVDGLVRFTHPDAHALVARVAQVAGDDALSVTVSRPTLAEAFVSLTGSRWEGGR